MGSLLSRHVTGTRTRSEICPTCLQGIEVRDRDLCSAEHSHNIRTRLGAAIAGNYWPYEDILLTHQNGTAEVHAEERDHTVPMQQCTLSERIKSLTTTHSNHNNRIGDERLTRPDALLSFW